jgi:hypothetical protein
MHKITAIVVGTALSAATYTLFADEQPKEGRLQAIVAPFVDGQTIAVMHLDLTKFDATKSIDACALALQWPQPMRDRLQADVAPLNVVTQGLREGANIDAFLVISLSDLSRVPFFLVLPVDETTPAAAIAHEARRAIEKSWHRQLITEQLVDRLITGAPETIERLKESKSVDRPELAAVFRAVDTSAVKIAWIPSVQLRRLAETVLPNLPAQLGGGPTKTFTEGVVWAAIGIDLPPQRIAVRVVLQSTSNAAAVSLERAIAEVFDAVGRLPQNQAAVPDFDKHLNRLAPKAQGDQLLLELTEQNKGIAALTAVLPRLLTGIYAIRARQ